jgi:hypothetical protein
VTKPIPTIKRRKSWPKWAKFFCHQNPALNRPPHGRLSAYLPVIHESCFTFSTPHWGCTGTNGHVRPPRTSRDWRKSLRRIVP